MNQPMEDVTRLLRLIEEGDEHAVDRLFSLVYGELRKLASANLWKKGSDTVYVTELVNEAYLRLVDKDGKALKFQSRKHFFGAASEAMRRILVDDARKRLSLKRGGGIQPVRLDETFSASKDKLEEIVAVNDALLTLEQHDASAAKLVKLRYFVGLTHKEAAEAIGISVTSADRLWAITKTWLYRQLNNQ